MDSRQTVKTITRHTCFNKKEENINVDLLIMNKYIVVIIQWKNGWNVFTCRSWDTTAAHISITIWWKHIFGLRECLNSILTVTASHSCCEPLVPPHSKDVPLDWDLMTAEAAWVHWIEIISGLWHGVIPCWKQPSDDENTVVIKGPHRVHMIIIRNHTLVRLWHPHNIHLLWMNLKRAKKISTTPLRHTTVVLTTGYLSYCCGPIRSKQCGLRHQQGIFAQTAAHWIFYIQTCHSKFLKSLKHTHTLMLTLNFCRSFWSCLKCLNALSSLQLYWQTKIFALPSSWTGAVSVHYNRAARWKGVCRVLLTITENPQKGSFARIHGASYSGALLHGSECRLKKVICH